MSLIDGCDCPACRAERLAKVGSELPARLREAGDGQAGIRGGRYGKDERA
jgi:hypothetical protein